MSQKHIPPLPSLRAFEASARLGSFTAAALELNVTQSAVSQAVHQLEQMLGRELFFRKVGAIELTPEARRYGASLSTLLDNLLEATNAVAMEDTPVTVAAARSLLNHWLLPRLGKFQKLHPDVSLQVIGLDRGTIDPSADISLITAAIAAPPVDSQLLWTDRLVMVASPNLAKSVQAQGNSLEGIPLIDTFGSDWSKWSLDAPPAASSRSSLILRLREATAILRAAIEGLGVALLSEFLASDDLKAGRLMLLSERRLMRDQGVWLQVRLQTPSTNAALFSNWLRDEAKSTHLENP